MTAPKAPKEPTELEQALDALSVKQRTFVVSLMGVSKGNKYKAYVAAYGDESSRADTDTMASRLSRNVKIVRAIKAIEVSRAVETAVETEHNRELSIGLLRKALEWAKPAAMKGGVQAINAFTGIVRELNAISNLHSSKITTETTPPEIAPAELETYKDAARVIKLKIAGGGQ